MKEEDRIVKFIFENHNRLSCILRYNNTPKLLSESVAEHSYYVTFLAMIIGDYLSDKGVELDKLKLLKMSIVHDMEEIISGDIIKILKVGEFKIALDKLSQKSMHYLCDILGEQRAEEYYALWEEVKVRKSLEARIVDMADLLSCLIYSVKELHCGNRYFREILVYVSETIRSFIGVIPEVEKLIRAFVAYTKKYLADDQRIINGIDSAVRMDKED